MCEGGFMKNIAINRMALATAVAAGLIFVAGGGKAAIQLPLFYDDGSNPPPTLVAWSGL
jgi:hypothetical protein